MALREGRSETIQYLRQDLLGMPLAHRLITNVFEQTGLSASVGVTLAPTSSQTHLDIVELADNALRLAKTTGKNAVRIASAA